MIVDLGGPPNPDVYYDNTDDGGIQRGSTATRRRRIKAIIFTEKF